MENTAHSNSLETKDNKRILGKMERYSTSNLLQHEIDEIVQSLLLKEEQQAK